MYMSVFIMGNKRKPLISNDVRIPQVIYYNVLIEPISLTNSERTSVGTLDNVLKLIESMKNNL